jgi:hypothetical protein
VSELREKLAALAHEQWAGWMRYLFKRTYSEPGMGSKVIPYDSAFRWERLMNTPYEKLTEQEKESDRAEADRVLAVLKADDDSVCASCPRQLAALRRLLAEMPLRSGLRNSLSWAGD